MIVCKILLIFIGLLLVFLVIEGAVLYGMDLGNGFCDNFIDWIKKNHRINKEIVEETKAEKAFLKANPLCRECQKSGRYRKAEYCNREGTELIPACREHHISLYEQHKKEAETDGQTD